MSELVWEDPPPSASSETPRIEAHVEALQGNPGQWAKVAAGVRSPNRAKAYRDRGCKTAQRGKRGGPYDIYAMWPGENNNN